MYNVLFKLKNKIIEINRDNSGIAVIEIILIIVVLIGLVIVFKNQALSLVTKIWKTITQDAGSITG